MKKLSDRLQALISDGEIPLSDAWGKLIDDLKDEEAIIVAAEKLVRCKGRYHSEQNYRSLAAIFGVTVPDLPSLEGEQQQTPFYPDTLPCPVRLEPGLLFGKGVPTSTMLDALQRRAEYHEELESMTPEERVEREQNIKAFKAALETGQAFSPFEEVSIEELQRRYPPKPDQQ